MSDGPNREGRIRIPRRAALKVMALGAVTGAVGLAIGRISSSQDQPANISGHSKEEIPSDPNKKETIQEGLMNFRKALFDEVNLAPNLSLFNAMADLASKDESEINKYFQFKQTRLSENFSLEDGEEDLIDKGYRYYLNGRYQNGDFFDIENFSTKTLNGNLRQERLEFYFNRNGEIIGAPVFGVREPLKFSKPELVTLVEKALKNAPQGNQWIMGSGELGDRPEGSIYWSQTTTDLYKQIDIGSNGRVVITKQGNPSAL